jgi:hypothetical protein
MGFQNPILYLFKPMQAYLQRKIFPKRFMLNKVCITKIMFENIIL